MVCNCILHTGVAVYMFYALTGDECRVQNIYFIILFVNLHCSFCVFISTYWLIIIYSYILIILSNKLPMV